MSGRDALLEPACRKERFSPRRRHALGPDTVDEAGSICDAAAQLRSGAPRRTPKAWRDWMLKGTAATDSPECDTSALQRNFALGKKHCIRGTRGLVFENGHQRAR